MTDEAINWAERIPDLTEREEAARLLLAIDNAKRAYADHPLALCGVDGMGGVLRCAISGVPLTVTDEIVEDNETGEVWLRSALGLPPRDPELVEQEDTEDESEFEDA